MGKAIKVVASYTDGHGTVEHVSSAATSAVLNVNDLPTGSVTVAGTATQGVTLTASNTLADADGLGTIGYQWQSSSNGTTWSDIGGAIGSSFTLTDSQVGKTVKVVASYTDGHGTYESIVSATTEAVLGSDHIAPEVLSFSPADAATGVSIHSNIILKFSEAVHLGSGAIEIHSGSATGNLFESYAAATDTTHLTVSGDTLTINPSADLANSTDYYVTFADGSIQDLAGNHYAGTSLYDFTTAAASNPSIPDLTGSIKFWKTGSPISGVMSTISSVHATDGSQPVEFRITQVGADGSRTIEIWETSSHIDIDSLQLELSLPAGSTASWQDATMPAGWFSMANTDTAGQFILGGFGLTALSSGPVKLGTLSLSAPVNSSHFEMQLTSALLANESIPGFRIVSDTMITEADGAYQHPDMASGGYILETTKVVDASVINAVKANDALAALKIAVNMNPNGDGSTVAPYQYLAADVNRDGKVNVVDALNILKMAVHLDTAPASEWLFVPDSVGAETMNRTAVHWPDSSVSVMLDQNQELQLIGIVKGDVNGSWVA